MPSKKNVKAKGRTTRAADKGKRRELVLVRVFVAIEAMKSAGLDLASVAGGTYNEVTPRRRLVYTTLADFIPDVAPYEVVAMVELHPTAQGVRLVVKEDAMHDDLWTERSTMGMDSSLDRLVKFLDARSGRRQTTR